MLLLTLLLCVFALPAIASDPKIMGTPGWTPSPNAPTAPSDEAEAPGAVLTPATCNGSLLVLTPPTAPPNFGADGSTNERGVYVTAIKDFQICSMAFKMSVSGLPQTLFAYIYAANGTTRGALLASGSVAMSGLGNLLHFVPVSYTLKACQDYELVFLIPGGDAWEWWYEKACLCSPFTDEPFDIGGAIRVRDGSFNGDPSNFALPHIEVIGTPASLAAQMSDFGQGTVPNSAPDDNQERGIYVHMLDTAQLCSFGFEANLVAGQTLTATVYNATGTTRGAAFATGTYTVPSSGLQWHDVPVNVQLIEGGDYDIAIAFGTANSWPWWSEFAITEPFTKDVFSVVDAEMLGTASNTALPHYRAKWESKTGGGPIDLAKPDGGLPFSANQGFSEFGAYVTAVVSQELYGVGWEADVPAGQTITALVYAATGLTRGALITSGTIVSSGPGMRFHDIPLAVELVAGVDYDISIRWNTVTELRYWDDTVGIMPYTRYGVLQVRNSEGGFSPSTGDANNFALIHMRIHGCNEAITPVSNGPVRTPMFMAVPAPNPVADVSRLNFSMEEGGQVSIHVYDVAGRLVSTVLQGSRPGGWSSVDINSKNLASGVYFLKMQTNAGTLTRKFVVTH